MDDDDKLKAEFPLGDELSVVVREPSEGQILVLALSHVRPDADKATQWRVAKKLFSILERLVTPTVWYEVIETALIEERLSPTELLKFAREVTEFKWDEHRPSPEPEPQDGFAEADALMAKAMDTPRPGPRIVGSGG